jgi:hypothetical protein
MRKVISAAIALWIAAGVVHAAPRPLWLAVTTAQLAPSIQPLADRRRSEGLDVVVFIGQPKAALAENPKAAYLVLVGDVPGPGETADAAWFVEAKEFLLYRWISGQPEKFSSDSMWGELDGDELPDVPVGRIPARNPDEAALVVRKILAYEDRPWSTEDLRLPVWTGAPLSSPAIDRVMTGLVVQGTRSQLPGWGEASLICGDVRSSFCGWPAEQPLTFNRWLKRGGFLATVGAHGGEDNWLSVVTPRQQYSYRVRESDRELKSGGPTCPLVVLTCLSGNFASSDRCITEAMVLAPGGPVAAAGATTESHPLPNYLTARGLLTALAAEPKRLGELWLGGLRRGHDLRDLIMEPVLKDMEGSLDEKIDVAALRRDQLRIYALMGDPATRIRVPRALSASLERHDHGWRWHAKRPVGASALHVHFRSDNQKLPDRPPEVGREEAIALHEQANTLFAYKPVTTLSSDESWQGEITERGEIRLVAMAPDCWFATVLKTTEEH